MSLFRLKISWNGNKNKKKNDFKNNYTALCLKAGELSEKIQYC